MYSYSKFNSGEKYHFIFLSLDADICWSHFYAFNQPIILEGWWYWIFPDYEAITTGTACRLASLTADVRLTLQVIFLLVNQDIKEYYYSDLAFLIFLHLLLDSGEGLRWSFIKSLKTTFYWAFIFWYVYIYIFECEALLVLYSLYIHCLNLTVCLSVIVAACVWLFVYEAFESKVLLNILESIT